jgi:hypothetical protein
LTDQPYDELEQDEHQQVLLHEFFAFGHRIKYAHSLVHDEGNREIEQPGDNEARYDAQHQPDCHQHATQ